MPGLPTDAEILGLHKKYAPNEQAYKAVVEHCEVVAEIALWCADNSQEPVDKQLLKAAALLHDIGSYPFLGACNFSPEYKLCYPQHAILGSKIVQDEGYDKSIWSLIETHVLLGLTKEEIANGDRAMPERNYEPKTIEGRLLCYADRFHSKHDTNVFNSFDNFHAHLLEMLPKQAKKFMDWSKEFGVPDIDALAKKYNSPIR